MTMPALVGDAHGVYRIRIAGNRRPRAELHWWWRPPRACRVAQAPLLLCACSRIFAYEGNYFGVLGDTEWCLRCRLRVSDAKPSPTSKWICKAKLFEAVRHSQLKGRTDRYARQHRLGLGEAG